MSGRVEGKVALITGAGRGQGRSHAIRLAEEGADIIAIDACTDFPTMTYAMASEEDLEQTGKQVEALDRRIITAKVDIRDAAGLASAIDDGVSEFGRLDVVVANAGIAALASWDKTSPQVWQDIIDVNLTGTWNTMVAGAKHLVQGGGGSIIATSSAAGLKGYPFMAPYVAAKHGITGIVNAMANELARHNIRVNSIHPNGVDTPMCNEALDDMQALLAENPDMGPILMNSLPIELVDARDISNAVLFLASDESRYVTGLQFKVDAGCCNR